MSKDYYKILGLNNSATQEEIADAYRKLARKYHPDVCPNDPDALAKFKEAAEAYEVLGDPDKRRRYDNPAPNWPGFDIASFVFKNNRKQENKDAKQQIILTFLESITGCEKSITVPVKKQCTECSGKGWNNISRCEECDGLGARTIHQGPFSMQTICEYCSGKGEIKSNKCTVCENGFVFEKDEIINVKLAKAISDGTVLKIKNKGQYTPSGRGNLFLHIFVESHPVFQRMGLDVHYKMPVSYACLTLGRVITVPTIHGDCQTNIPPGSPNGCRVRLKDKGFHDNHGNKGDLYVTFMIPVPTNISDEYATKLRELEKLEIQQPLKDMIDFNELAHI